MCGGNEVKHFDKKVGEDGWYLAQRTKGQWSVWETHIRQVGDLVLGLRWYLTPGAQYEASLDVMRGISAGSRVLTGMAPSVEEAKRRVEEEVLRLASVEPGAAWTEAATLLRRENPELQAAEDPRDEGARESVGEFLKRRGEGPSADWIQAWSRLADKTGGDGS